MSDWFMLVVVNIALSWKYNTILFSIPYYMSMPGCFGWHLMRTTQMKNTLGLDWSIKFEIIVKHKCLLLEIR
jgi:hypothetical protein